MRIGELNKDNYESYLKLFGIKSNKTLDDLMGKNKTENAELTEEEVIAKLVKSGYIEDGMYIGGSDKSWQKIVPVSQEIKDKLIATVRRQFLTNGNGMSGTRDGDEIGAIMKAYRKNIPPSERLSVTFTLEQIVYDETVRMLDYVKANDPGWDYGKPIDKKVLADAVSGNHIDTKI